MDAELVEAGVRQAEALSKFWTENAQDGMPLPTTIYSSPLRRCLKTTELVYSQLLREGGHNFKPIVKEKLRERLTDHTCDKRSPRSWIAEHYPDFVIEDGFVESDELWEAWRNPPENHDNHVQRVYELLSEIFTHDSSPFISLSAHSYALTAILCSLGTVTEQTFRVGEGVMVPLFVKATRKPLVNSLV